MKPLVVLMLLAGSVSAGELELDLGLQATTTAWPGDHGGGGTMAAGWWFLPWLGASYLGKEQYATVDDRLLSYFSLNAAVRHVVGPLRVTGTLGLVHQHEESRAAWMANPSESVFGVGDGIRHRMGGRAGVSVALPIRGPIDIALDLDLTAFMDSDRGPRWMASTGVSVGFTHDFASAR